MLSSFLSYRFSLSLSLSLSHERVSCAEWQQAIASSCMMQQQAQEQDKDTRHHRTCTGLATGMPLRPVSTLCLWLVSHNTDAQYINLVCRPRHTQGVQIQSIHTNWLQVGVCVPIHRYTHKYTNTLAQAYFTRSLSLSLSHERGSCAEWQHATASSSMMQQEVQEQDKDTRHHRTCTGLATGILLLPASTLCHWLVCHNPNAQYI